MKVTTQAESPMGGEKPEPMVSRRRLLQASGGLAAMALGAPLLPRLASAQGTPAPSYITHKDVKGEITFWHFWGSPLRRNAIRRIVANFEKDFPGVKVKETYIPFDQIWNKNLAAVAAGKGMPDVIVEDRPSLAQRAKDKIEISLADLAKRDNVTGAPFWPFTWKEATPNGLLYGLPYETDIRVMYYNKAQFIDAGLDPNKPPANWDELWSTADKLDQKGGQLKQVAFFPTFGNFGLDQWAWNNGGHWQDANDNPTFNIPPNVGALTWMKKWGDRYDYTKVKALQSTFGSGNQDGFMSGKVSMICDIQGYTSVMNFYNAKFTTKNKEDAGYGIAPIPPAAGHKPASLSGGFALAIPTGSKQVDATWEFIKYAVFIGQASWARDTYAMPTIESIAKTDTDLNADPNWKFFVQAMSYGRPAVENPYYPAMISDLTPIATEDALSGSKSPQAALDEAQQKAEAEIKRKKNQ